MSELSAGCLLMAAGNASRFGENKLAACFDGQSLFSLALAAIPAEMFAFPALLPMIPGMFAYKTILATMQFLGATAMSLRQELLVDIVYNGLTAFFIMCALVIGAVLPLLAFHRESPLVRGIRKLRRRGSTEG